MNGIDWVILVVILLSIGVGLLRGIIREILSIVGWVVSILLALRFSPNVAGFIPIDSLSLGIKTVFGAVVIVVVTLFAFGMFGRLMGRVMSAARITFEDRTIGAVFGFVRGVVIVCACVFLLGMTSYTRTEIWRSSMLIIPCERVIEFAMPYLPKDIASMRSQYQVF